MVNQMLRVPKNFLQILDSVFLLPTAGIFYDIRGIGSLNSF
jgi:hypothetical protein